MSDSLSRPPTPPSPESGLVDISGVIHCHSTYSDGAGTLDEIVVSARRANLDYLIMTDHDTLVPRDAFGERWLDGGSHGPARADRGRTLLLFADEISPPTNHCLAFGLERHPTSRAPLKYLADVASQGGFAFAAHPDDRGNRLIGLPSYAWTEWRSDDIVGLEIWNYLSDWVGRTRTLPRLLVGLLAPWILRLGPSPATLARWDMIGQRRPIAALGGVDAHGLRPRLGPWRPRLLWYDAAFRTVRTHLWVPASAWVGGAPLSRSDEGVEAARRAVLTALRTGRGYVANWAVGDPRPFHCSLAVTREDGSVERVHPGETVRGPGRGVLRLSLPRAGRYRVIRDGYVIHRGIGQTWEGEVEGPGVFRVEVEGRRRGFWRTWIYTNHIYWRGEADSHG